MAILKLKDKDGNVIPIPAITGPPGTSAYEYAVAGGYEGTEEEFAEKLKELMDGDQGVSSWNDLEDKPFYEDEEGNIHYLDEKFIPDTIARKSYNNLLTESKDLVGAINELNDKFNSLADGDEVSY